MVVTRVFLEPILMLSFLKLEDKCFTMSCSFLLYTSVNQLYVHIYPLPVEPPSLSSRSLQSTELSSMCYTAAPHLLSILYLVVYISHSSLQYSCLENPMDRRAWRAAVHRVAKSRTWLKRLSNSTSVYISILISHFVSSHFSPCLQSGKYMGGRWYSYLGTA